MDPSENARAVAQELVSYAGQHGIDLEPFRKDYTFLKDRRWIDVWRKDVAVHTPIDGCQRMPPSN